MDAEIELEMAQGSTAQPPSTAQVRLLGDLGLSQGFLGVGGTAELISSLRHHRKAKVSSQTPRISWLCAKYLCPGCSRCPMTATCSGRWLPRLPHIPTHCRRWRWRPTQVTSLWVWGTIWWGSREMGLGREDGQMGNWAAWQGGWEAKMGASGHTVQMHPCPRPCHLCSLATPGAPHLLPGPISCILPSQGQ